MTSTKKKKKTPKTFKENVREAQKNLKNLRVRASKNINGTLDKYRKQANKVRVDASNRAFDSLGIATKKDISKITKALDKLRSEIRSLK